MAGFPGAFLFAKKPYSIYLMDAPVIPLFPGLKIKSAEENNSASIAQHPTEDGSLLTEHKIIMPRQINIEAYCADRATYALLKIAFADRKKMYGVRIKEVLVNNCVMSDMRVMRDGKVLSAIPVVITFTEVIKIAVSATKSKEDVKNQSDSSTSATGQVSGAAPPPSTQRDQHAAGIGSNT